MSNKTHLVQCLENEPGENSFHHKSILPAIINKLIFIQNIVALSII